MAQVDSTVMNKSVVNKITPLQQMISSCSGAMVTSLFVTPLDVVKVRLQAQQKQHFRSRCFLYCNGFIEELCCAVHSVGYNGSQAYWYQASDSRFTGTVDAFIKITRVEGISSLWSGLPTSLLMAVPATVVYFTVYDQLRDYLTHKCGVSHPPLWVPLAAGSSARVMAVTLISPLELVRTKMQSMKLSYVEIYEAVKIQIKSQGILSMYRGLGPTILRDVPFSALYWTNYELLKRYSEQRTPQFWFSFAAGAASGAIAAFLTLPFDVIKTHRQIELGEMMASHSSKSCTSTYVLLKDLYQRNGYRALFTGIVPRIVKVAPACAMMISSYEYGKKFFSNYNASKIELTM